MSAPAGPQSTAAAMIASFTCCGVSDGSTSRIRSATPVTNGAAMLVPLSVIDPFVVFARADVTLTPGPITSGLIRPSAVGPRLENGASLNPLSSMFDIAPTVNAAGAAAGDPIVHVPGPSLPAATETTSPAPTARATACEARSVPSAQPPVPSE